MSPVSMPGPLSRLEISLVCLIEQSITCRQSVTGTLAPGWACC
jgi:hypothetical protein